MHEFARDDAHVNALLFLGDHHQTSCQNPQCQKGGEEKADDEREDPREGTLRDRITSFAVAVIRKLRETKRDRRTDIDV